LRAELFAEGEAVLDFFVEDDDFTVRFFDGEAGDLETLFADAGFLFFDGAARFDFDEPLAVFDLPADLVADVEVPFLLRDAADVLAARELVEVFFFAFAAVLPGFVPVLGFAAVFDAALFVPVLGFFPLFGFAAVVFNGEVFTLVLFPLAAGFFF
jgi:hypothetical protein